MTPDQYCQEKAVQSGSSFYYSFLYLPLEKRRAITALYAFCREVDDVVDECTDTTVARAKLARWRNEIAAAYRGGARHPGGRALAGAAPGYHLPAARRTEANDGMTEELAYNR